VVVQLLTAALGLPLPIAQILVARGIQTPQAAHAFLHPGTGQLHDPFLFRDMEAAVERLATALKAKEKVLLYGDYDVDGLTATAILCQVLRQRGMQVEYYVPNRFEDGYGLNSARLRKAREAGITLAVTVDCGTRELDAAETARQLGLDLIVTDHHLPGPRLPSAFALLNPLREDGAYPDPHLCGAGVAYKLAQAFIQHQGGDPAEAERQLDLVAIGTVADIVPLIGENRVLVRQGLRRLHQSDRPGILALIEAAQIVQEQIGVRQIGFQLAPRMNALGRLGNAAGAVRLLLTEDLSEAAEIAALMNEANNERQRLQEKVIEEIRRISNAEPDRFSAPVICLGRPGWHRGVIGIAASKVLDWYNRPVILFSIEDGVAHGSARSIPGVDITHALSQCGDLIERFGGHDQAAGLTLRENNLPVFRHRLEGVVEKMLPEGALEPVLEIDAEVRLEQLTEPLAEQLIDLGPFGAANPRPVLAAMDVCAGDTARIVGNGSLKLMLAQGNTMHDAIAFGQGNRLGSVDLNRLDVAFYPEVNEWRGRRTLN
jgi:single-stranded-DNA-specific exonuclease